MVIMGAPKASNNTSQQQQQQQQPPQMAGIIDSGSRTADKVPTSIEAQLVADKNNHISGGNGGAGGSSSGSNKGTTLDTYLSLVSQYLAVNMLDNATWLAERCVAEYGHHSADACHLLALCHFRAGAPYRARLVLDGSRFCQSTTNHENDAAARSWFSVDGGHNNTIASMVYLSAMCSYQMEDYQRAADTLLEPCRRAFAIFQHQQHARADGDDKLTMNDFIVTSTPCPIPNGAAGLALLGKIYRANNSVELAIQYFKMSLQLDPFLFTSFQALVDLNAPDVDATQVFGGLPHHLLATAAAEPGVATAVGLPNNGNEHVTSSWSAAKTPLPPLMTPLGHHPAGPSSFANSMPASALVGHTAASSVRRGRHALFDTPNLTPIPVNTSLAAAGMNEATPIRNNNAQHDNIGGGGTALVRRARDVVARQYYPPTPETPLTAVTRSMTYLRGLGNATKTLSNNITGDAPSGTTICDSQPVGSRSLFTTSSSENQAIQNHQEHNNATGQNASAALGGANANNAHALHPTQQQASVPPSDAVSEEPDKKPLVSIATANKEPEGKVDEVLALLTVAGSCYQQLQQYRCREALQAVAMMPSCHQDSGWVLHQQGRAYLELNEFTSAQRCLERMQVQDPGRLQGLELLSTVYWQLKKEVDMAHLAHRVVEMDHLAPETWCVVGNCFSLQKDHEQALAFFKRSLQIDPSFTYTHTLSGHEYLANEDFDKAIACFREAIKNDARHYNAWYGLGAIYHRQEKFDMAEYYFERAVRLHPGSSILRCNLGIAQFANGKAHQALDTLQAAFALDPHNPQARYQRATIFMALHRPEDALTELRKVRDAAPREATVHFNMGKVLKRLKRPEEAMKCFLTAMDLDPKDNQLIKAAMDKLDAPEVEDDPTVPF